MTPVRLAILTEIPAPFRIPLFNSLAAREDVSLTVFFLSARNPDRPYHLYREEFAFRWEILPGRDWMLASRWLVLNRGVARALRHADPEVLVVGGWNQPAFWQALVHARLHRRPLVAWVESTARDARPGARSFELAKRALIRGCSGFLVPGRASSEYLRSLGVAPERITVAPNAVAADIFGAGVAAARRDREGLRRALGLDGCVFLYVGRLDEGKGVDSLLRAFASVPGELVVVGTGPSERALRAASPPRVRFLGWLDRDELVPWYAAADAFVFPTRSDTWGMVLSEAASAGLPLVASEVAGAAWDLIEEGVNGFRVPPDNEKALAAALRRLAEDPSFRAAAGSRTRELTAGFTPEEWARSVARLARQHARAEGGI